MLNGSKCIPDKLTKGIGRWPFKEPFNNQYVCFTRDEVPIATPISDIVDRIEAIAKEAILDNGGRLVIDEGDAPSVEEKTVSFEYDGVDYTIEFGEENKATLSGGDLEDSDTYYIQNGASVRIANDKLMLEGIYDGKGMNSVKAIQASDWKDSSYGDLVYIVNTDF